MRRFSYRLELLVIIMIAVISMSAVYADAGLEVKVGAGYDKDNDTLYKIGYLTPVKLQIKNSLKDINGEIQIEAANSNGNITIYAKPLNMSKDSSKTVVLNVPLLTYIVDLRINIVEDDKPIYTKKAKISPGVGGDTLLIGFLSDDYESIRYIDKIPSPNPVTGTNTVRLTKDTFPEDKDLLAAFNLIIINNFDTSQLNNDQYEALKSWVADGGTLLIGTGPFGSKTLGAFKDDFIIGDTGDSKVISTFALNAMAKKASGEMPLSLDILQFTIKDGEPILKEGDIILAEKIKKGRGTIGVCAFDFGLKPLTEWAGNRNFSEALIDNLIPSWVKANWTKEMTFEQNFYLLDNALRNIPELSLPGVSYLIILFAIYILAAGPINYIILKRMDKREYMWVTIPALALIFAAINYFAGTGTRINEPIANIISVINVEEGGGLRNKIYAGIFNPNKANLKVEAENGMRFKPYVFSSFYNGRYFDIEKRVIDSKVMLAPKSSVEFYKTGVWDMRFIEMELEKPQNGSLKSNLNYSNGKVAGTIENHTGYDLDELYIMAANQFALVGTIKNGETKNIDMPMKSYFGNKYDLLNMIYKDPYSDRRSKDVKLSEEEKRTYREEQQKRQVMESYIHDGINNTSAQLIGWSNTPTAKKVYVNGKAVKKIEKSFIYADLNISFRNGSIVEYPLGYIRPEIVGGIDNKHYDEYSNVFYGNGTIELHYKIDKNVVVDEISLKFYSSKDRIRQFIWDTEKSAWIEGSNKDMELYRSDIKKYIDSDNVLKLKFDITEANLHVPQIQVKGRVKQ